MPALLDRISRELVRVDAPLTGEVLPRRRSWLDFSSMLESFTVGGNQYTAVLGSGSRTEERIETNFRGLVEGAFKRHGPVFACMALRMRAFSEARFMYRQLRSGRPGDLFSLSPANGGDLEILRRPWRAATTGDLLTRMILDADLAGNAFIARRPARLRRLRPDWVTIVLGAYVDADQLAAQLTSGDDLDADVLGYIYGPDDGVTLPEVLMPEEVAHFAPIPDPVANYRGQSWLTPIIREILTDQAATTHKLKFFERGATLQVVVSMDKDISVEAFDEFVARFRVTHEGVDNSYKCLHPSTEVALWNGARCRADEVQAGDLVVAWSDGRAVPGVVTAVQDQPTAPIVEVKTQRGRVIRSNGPHPFLTANGWIAAQDLQRGDRLVTGLGWGRPRLQDSLTPAEAWLLGVLVGDGCFVSSTAVVSVADEGILSYLETLVPLTKTSNPKGPYDYRVGGVVELVKAAGLAGKRSWEKTIPPAVMTGGVEVVSAFLSGLIDSDGHVTEHQPTAGITSTSWQLLADAQHLLASLGVNASISQPPSMRRDAPGGGSGKGRRRDAYRLHVFGVGQARRLAEVLTLRHTEKARRLREHAKKESSQDRSRFDRVVSVRVLDPEPTIGIEVAGYHTHVTGGVVTHNTLFLGGGADVTTVTANMAEVEMKALQGLSETRIASVAATHSVVVGFSEGMQGSSLNAGNYKAAVRNFADLTMRPLWRNAAGSLESIVDVPEDAELWYDDRDIAFLRDDQTDVADIQAKDAAAIRQLVDGGFKPDAVVDAVAARDLRRLVGQHSGLPPVQVQAAKADGGGNGKVPSVVGTNGSGGG